MGAKGNGAGINRLIADTQNVVAHMEAENAALREHIEGLSQVIKLQQKRLARYTIALLEVLGDKDFSDPSQPVHSVSAEHIMRLERQQVGVQVVQRPKSHALDIYMWTGKAGDLAARERERAQDAAPPQENLEQMLPAVITPQ